MSTDNAAQQAPPDTNPNAGPPADPETGSGTDPGTDSGTTSGTGTGTDCGDCQTGMSEVKCEAEGIAAQAAFNEKSQPPLLTAEETYAEARKKYREQRCLIHNEVVDLENQAKNQLERARCLIRQKRVVTCLEDAWDNVKKELKSCAKPPCCSELDCTFSTDTTDLDDQQLDNRISDVTTQVAEATACFNNLAGEPDALTQRLADLKAEIAKITALLADNTGKVDPKTVWAQARVALWHAKHFWQGFERTSDYTECLCAALTCWTNGTATLSELTRQQAVRACHKNRADARCETVRTRTVEEILAVYDKDCPTSDCGCGCGDKDKGQDGDEKPCGCGKHQHQGDDEVCGCGKHHHHQDDDEVCGCGRHHSGETTAS